jgi:hypothetical protein
MIYEIKVKKRLSTMHNMKTIPSWLFHILNAKILFFILAFCINIYSFVNNFLNNVNIST